MKEIIYSLSWVLVLQVCLFACKEDEPVLGPPPSAEEATFVYAPSSTSDNILVLTNSSSAFLKKWDFGNGETAEGDNVQVTYPFQGTYEVTLTVFTSGGSVSSKQTIEIPETDLSLLKPVYTLLTGGEAYPDGKKWIIDASRAGHMGIGPADAASPIWWAAPPNDKSETGLYDDKHTFQLDGFVFIQETNGDVYLNGAQQANFPGAFANKGDFTAPFTAPDNLSWSITENTQGQQFINIMNGGFIGYYAGSSTYEILSITENELNIKYIDAAVPANAWFLRLIPEGFEPPPPPPPASTTLPVDFESVEPPFNGFGGSVFNVVDNPDPAGINTSAKVGQYVKGTDGNWAGIETTLNAKLDFSTNTVFKYKVYSPVAGRALFKIEDSANNTNFVEVFADVTQVNQWQELTFDFSAAASNTYDKIALFLDFDNNAGGTFYLDDIHQTFIPAGLTLNDLTGGSSRAWVLKPVAGSFGVGPAKGSTEWFGSADLSADRPCLFNDEYIFKTGDIYEYDSQDDIFAEDYMGLTAGCTNEANLPADAQAWGSGTHSFTFTPATDSSPATISITGTGAFIALPKAYSGGEYAAAPPATDGTVTYEVLSYVKNGSDETLTIAVDISADGTAFWTFVLIPKP